MTARTELLKVRRWGLGVSALVFTAGLVHFVNVSYDDAFISFRYAENLAGGNGLVFNPGERVEGYSNFLWTLLLTLPALVGVGRLPLGMLLAAKLLGAASAFGTLALVGLTRALPEGAPRAAAWPLGASYLALLAPYAFWAGAGLETALLGLLLTAVVVLDQRERARGFGGMPWSFLALCLAALTRPEPVLMFPSLLLLRCGELEPGQRARGSAIAALSFGLPYATFIGARLAYYGQWVPNTYFAKRADDPDAWSRGWSYFTEGASALGWWWVLPAVIVALMLGRRWSRANLVIFALLVTHIVSVVFDGGDWMMAHRLLVPALPLVALLLDRAWSSAGELNGGALRLGAVPAWVMPAAWVSAWNGRVGSWLALRPGRGRRGLAVAAMLLLGGSALSSGVESYLAWLGAPGSGFGGIDLAQGRNFEIAFWLRDHLERRGLVATGEAGIIPYYTRLPLLDLFGLMDPHLSHLSGALHRKFDSDYVLSRRPLYVMLPVNRFDDGGVTGAHHYAQALLHDARFARDYVVMREFQEGILYRRRVP